MVEAVIDAAAAEPVFWSAWSADNFGKSMTWCTLKECEMGRDTITLSEMALPEREGLTHQL